MHWLALDIGGANLKAADGLGYAESCSFPLWREADHLAQELRTVIAQAPKCDHLVVTMTGELADCFESKAAGVAFILNAVSEAADGRHARVYLSDGNFVTPQVATARPLAVAAANWHALARFAGRFAQQGPALLIDVGSTTCDIIPLLDGVPATNHRTDTDRLVHGELVYAGIERTPVCALVNKVTYRGQSCPVAREVFATTRDVFTLLGRLPEAALNQDTADGRPATKPAARVRLGRTICADESEFNHRDAAVLAEEVAAALVAELADSVQQVLTLRGWRPATVVFSGHGEFVAQAALERLGQSPQQVLLRREIGEKASRCAPAHALAVLAREAAGA